MRPIIVGIAGKRGLDPLYPYPYPGSGGRLARLAGLTAEEFLVAFDRVNLYTYGEDVGKDGDDDDEALRNLLPILRGRRVIGLGNRVADALGIDGCSMEWSILSGFVGAAMPHPSGLSRWWNIRRNGERASKFMKQSLLPCIHVEGPDGSGKSTVVDDMFDASEGMTRVMTGDPPKSWEECVRRINRRITPGLICDRSSGLISELVYGPVLRGCTIVAEDLMWDVLRSLIYSVTFVHCRPSCLIPTWREGEDPAHVEAVKDNLKNLAARYDDVFDRICWEGGRVLRYNRHNGDTPEGILRCVGL